jgi:pectin methylesterase-like acyl-CoA thioesterase
MSLKLPERVQQLDLSLASSSRGMPLTTYGTHALLSGGSREKRWRVTGTACNYVRVHLRSLLLGYSALCLVSACGEGSAGDVEPSAGSPNGGSTAPGGAGGREHAGQTNVAGSSGAPSGGVGTAGANAGAAGTSIVAGAGGNDGGTGGASSGGVTGTAGGGSSGAGGAPTVELPPGVIGLFPLPGATNICADPALRLRFANPPKLGSSGKLRVFDASAPNAAVITVDFAAMSVTQSFGGQSYNQARPIFVEGSDVVLPLLSTALGYGKQYYVTVEAGAIQPASGTFSITDPQGWRFSTWGAAPTGSKLSVALDGTGQFCSWQGAFDAVPAKNTAAVTIEIKSGRYHGLVNVNGKQNITVRGQDRKQTILSGVNNDKLNAGTLARALFGADSTNGLVLENLTIQNLTPQGGMQAEAVRLQSCDQCVVRKADIISLQDTLLWSGVIYAEDCYIAGNVDWIWGTGSVYFNRCEIKNLGRSGYIVQSRNGAGQYGYVFVDSKITTDAGITGTTLARIDVSAYPDSHVAYINCTLGSHISRAGWTVTGGSAPGSLRFWEYQSKDASGALIDVSGRVGGKQISADQAAQMRDPKVVLGGWQPPP